MRRFVFAGLLAVTVLSACQSANTEMTEVQRGEIAAEVELLHGQFLDATRAADVERVMSYFRNSPEFVVANGGQLINFAATYDAFQWAFTNIVSQTITNTESQTTVLAPNVVCIVEQAMGAKTDTLGVTGPETAFANTNIWVLRDGEWKINHMHLSSPTPETP